MEIARISGLYIEARTQPDLPAWSGISLRSMSASRIASSAGELFLLVFSWPRFFHKVSFPPESPFARR